MLYEFINTNRADLIERCRAKVASRPSPKATPAELEHGVPMFLEQLIKTLRKEEQDARRVGPVEVAKKEASDETEIGKTATRHGLELLNQGFTIDQVVHDYGDVCQAVTELAGETGSAITVEEFRTLNRCLDNAIASAVTEFSTGHDSRLTNDNLHVSDELARALLHELQAHVQAATFAIAAIKTGNVGMNGATAALLDLSLISMRTLIDRSLAEVKSNAGLLARH